MRVKYIGKKSGGWNIYLPIGSIAKGNGFVKKVVNANPFADLSPEDAAGAVALDPQALVLVPVEKKEVEEKIAPEVGEVAPVKKVRGRKKA